MTPSRVVSRPVGLGLIILLAALLVFLIALLLGFGVFSGAHVIGWVALGLFLFVLSILVP